MADLGWGVGGIQQANQDYQAQQLFNLSMAEGQQKLEVGRRAIAQQDAQLAALRKMAAAQAGQTPADEPTQLEHIAQIMLDTGQPDAYREMVSTAATLRHNQAESQKIQMDLGQTKLKLLGTLYEGVTDDATKQRADAMYPMQLAAMGLPPEKSPYAGQRFSPQLVTDLQNGVTTALQRIDMDKARAEIQRINDTDVAERHRVALIDAETESHKAYVARVKKAGGDTPSDKALEPITDLIAGDYGKQTKDNLPERRSIARDIYDRAQDYVNNSGLTREEAMKKAYQDAKQRGTMKGLEADQKQGLESVVTQIDGLLAKIRTGVPVAGGFGTLERWGEKVIPGTRNTSIEFASGMRLLIPQLSKALDVKSRTSAKEREQFDSAVNSLKAFSTAKEAEAKLQVIRKVLTGQDERSGSIDRTSRGGTPKVSSQADYDAIDTSNGPVQYIAPDGTTRTKPKRTT